MPSLPRLALVLALLPCSCFKDLGASDDAPADASADASTSTSSTSAAASSTGELITSSDPSNPDDDGTSPGHCGDGILDKDEGCDDGPENGPERPCTPDCQANVCGDGYPAKTEACDDHNTTNGDGCSATCVPETCGDGIVAAPAESCDDGNDFKGDGCRACQLEYLRVFVTVAELTGDLMTTSLADDTCAQEAAAAQLPGTYLAWLSTVTVAASGRFSAGTLPYVRADGLMFAASLAALTTTGPLSPLEVTAAGDTLLGEKDVCQNYVWTGTAATGESTPMWTCDGFTSQKLENTGTAGNFAAIDARWTDACQYQCSQTAHLYCFEQIP